MHFGHRPIYKPRTDKHTHIHAYKIKTSKNNYKKNERKLERKEKKKKRRKKKEREKTEKLT